MLIEDGKVKAANLRRELITMAQLEAAGRKQGFESLTEVHQCILEPGGTITFVGKKPGTDETRHKELLDRMEKLMAEVVKLRTAKPPAGV